MTTEQIAARLVELCSQGRFHEAMEELYAEDAFQHEAMSMPGMEQRVQGKDKLRAGSKEWMESNEIHGFAVEGPWPCGDRFIVMMEIDVTAKKGPMAGIRMKMKEACLYETKNGKITGATFFYAMPNM